MFSINDVSVARYVSPPLTTFHIDAAILCESALELIRNKILNGGVITKSIFVNGLPVTERAPNKRHCEKSLIKGSFFYLLCHIDEKTHECYLKVNK